MAKTYTVKKGDCLWDIAKSQLGDPLRWTEIADKNNISRDNPIIHPGQVLNLDVGQSSSTSASDPNNGMMATVEYFGLEAGTDRTIIATWKWDKEHTKEYKLRWWYATENNIALLGSETTTTFKHATYTAPANAERTWFHVLPISTTYKSNNKDVSHWSAKWSTQKTWYFKNNPPTKPDVPTVEIKNYTLTATLDNVDVNGSYIEFQIVKDNKKVFKTGKARITTKHASYSCDVSAGSEYKVRCRAARGNLSAQQPILYSEWSEYSGNVGTPPAKSEGITVLKALSETSVYIEWNAVVNADKYIIEYATKINYFDASSEVKSITTNQVIWYEVTGLESGETYYFRVRATNSKGDSPWTEIKSVVVGKKPTAPTTWSSTTTAIAGKPLTLYWLHNSQDGSSETYAELELLIDGVRTSHTIANTRPEEDKDKIRSYSIATSDYKEGTQIKWRVRTSGITREFGDWSIQRVVDIYAPPTLELDITDADGSSINTLTTFPFYISASPGPKTQAPVGYHVTITSNEIYTTTDNLGNEKFVNKGEAVYSKHFDTTESLLIELSASNITLENNITYTVSCTASMNSGLTVEDSLSLTVSWVQTGYVPNAEISIDSDVLSAHIRPYCEAYFLRAHKVNYDAVLNAYVKTSEILQGVDGPSTPDSAVTTTGELVYTTMGASGETIYFCMAVSETGTLIEGVMLSVYRREFDGSFTEIAKGLENTNHTFVTDPHPALDYARYRIVATTIATGAVEYYDLPGYPVQEKAAVIQWDEDWSYFDNVGEEQQEQPPWSGSMLKLPYNIDVSDSNSPDVALVKYIGRKRPMSYYGTQIGDGSTWNVEIDKTDTDTLYALRRLSIYMGNVYVREPSGSGYWANIKVSFSQKHRALTIPVTLDISRVEGGV